MIYKWSNYREYGTVECSALNETPMPTSTRLRECCGRGVWKERKLESRGECYHRAVTPVGPQQLGLPALDQASQQSRCGGGGACEEPPLPGWGRNAKVEE